MTDRVLIAAALGFLAGTVVFDVWNRRRDHFYQWENEMFGWWDREEAFK